ncbi:hypothetical protein C6501_06125 [Candidatus Poribacteria bacterium]|nr:MAG: hypothetical protein C6501_06125 [Candidatus Poribacteria bacterium]
MNKLYFGDNLEIMREMPSESVDLICTDPPFNSGRNYNAFFHESKAQSKAYTDIWQWDKAAQKSRTEIRKLAGASDTYKALDACLRGYDLMLQNAVSGNKGSMRAYLAFMGPRLVEMHRLLIDTGSIYLHCDPTASHYLKGVMDAIWDQKNLKKNEFYRNEIVWKRTHAHNDGNQFGRIHDIILFYRKNKKGVWNPIYAEPDPEYVKKNYTEPGKWGLYQPITLTGSGTTKDGESGKPWRDISPSDNAPRHWTAPEREAWPEEVQPPDNYESLSVHEKLDVLDDNDLIHWPKTSRGEKPRFKKYLSTYKGNRIQDLIIDVEKVTGDEDLDYDTQKPRALYERMIEASSNKDMLVMDPFCGCGTTIDAAQTLERLWIGIDITIIALDPIQHRMKDRHGLEPDKGYKIEGYPTNMQEVYGLVQDRKKRHDFSNWAVTRLGLKPTPNVGDGGKDGVGHVVLWNPDTDEDTPQRILAEVKSGKPKLDHVRAFCHTMTEQEAIAGIFITLEPVTKGMKQIAENMGTFEHINNQEYPRLQFWQIDDDYFEDPDILEHRIQLPHNWIQPRKKSERHFGNEQMSLLI